MRPVPLACECCRVEVLDRRGRTSYSVYRYNGEDHIGVDRLAAAVGVSANQIRSRLYRGLCLKATKLDLVQKRKRSGNSIDPRELARQFCVNMARSGFPSRVTVSRAERSQRFGGGQ